MHRVCELIKRTTHGWMFGLTCAAVLVVASAVFAQGSTRDFTKEDSETDDLTDPLDDNPSTSLSKKAQTNAPITPSPTSAPPIVEVVPRSSAAPVEPVAPEPPPVPEPPPTPPLVKVGGALIVFYRHPFLNETPTVPKAYYPYKDSFEIYRGQVLLDGKLDRFGLHLDVRVRDTKLKPFFAGTAWVEEAFGFGEIVSRESEYGPLVLKLGKIYQQFGRFWDNSFYGNIHLRDGVKLDPNMGLSIEGDLYKDNRFGAKYFLQYFVIDGGTNSSDPGRDTFSAKGTVEGASSAHRRNMVIGRVEPFAKIGAFVTFKLGLSGEYFQADLPAPVFSQDVTRLAGDLTAQVGPVAAWGEYIMQSGRSTTDFPYAYAAAGSATATAAATPEKPGRSADRVDYLLIGGQFTYRWFSARYNFSQGDYQNVPSETPGLIVPYLQRTHVPGIAFKANDMLTLMVEFCVWQTVENALTTTIDQSLVLSLHGRI